MFAVAFDLTVKEAERSHPVGVTQAYADIAGVLAKHDFEREQGRLYTSEAEGLTVLFAAVAELRALP